MKPSVTTALSAEMELKSQVDSLPIRGGAEQTGRLKSSPRPLSVSPCTKLKRPLMINSGLMWKNGNPWYVL